MTFYLGTHIPSWLWEIVNIPLFISAITLRKRKSIQPATVSWCLDSGGFSELSQYGKWTISPEQYVEEVRTWKSKIKKMEWAAIQDWMCEDFVLAKTKLSVEEHQRRTVNNYLRLKELAPEIHWMPVLQGFYLSEYLNCIKIYEQNGIDLKSLPIVGVGSICRRQGTDEAEFIIYKLHQYGIKIHGFGFKTQGLIKCKDWLVSADSLAWSFQARREPVLLEKCAGHQNCANCRRWALIWRKNLLSKL